MKYRIKSFFRKLVHGCIFFLLNSCSENIRISDIESLSDPDQILIHTIQFSTDIPSDAYLEYWNSEDSIRHFSSLSEEKVEHEIPVINVLSDQDYHFVVHTKSNNKKAQSKVQSFTTDILPEYLTGFKLYENEYSFPGYILIKTFHKNGTLIILNNKGEVVWYYPYNKPVVRPFNITSQHHIVSLVDSAYIEEIDLYGNLVNSINTKKYGIDKLHHELIKTDDGRYIGLTYENKPANLTKFGGLSNDNIRGDGMVVFDALGNIEFEWSVFDELDPLNDKDIFKNKLDWGHANSIAIDWDGNYLISFRDFSQIWKIHAISGEVLWKLGGNGDFKLSDDAISLRQHTAHINRNNNLLMFDNGNDDRGYSRVLSLKYNMENNSWDKELDLKLNKELTTFRMGSAYFIDDEHILVCSPKKLLNLTVLNTTGKIVWRLFSTSDSYRAIYLPPEFMENERWF